MKPQCANFSDNQRRPTHAKVLAHSGIKTFSSWNLLKICSYCIDVVVWQLRFRLSSSRAFGHIGQQLGAIAILNGQLRHIQPPPTWSRPSANPAGKFCATSSWCVLFYTCHPLESLLDDLVSVAYDQPYGICVLLQCLITFWSWAEQDFLVCNVVFICDF